MSTLTKIRPFYRVSTVDDGEILSLGSTADNKRGGEFVVQFVPEDGFEGSVQVVGHIAGIPARPDEEDAPDFQFPYRKIYVDGVAYSYEFSHDTLTGPFAIQIPANNWVIGLLVSCTAGTAKLFTREISEALSLQ